LIDRPSGGERVILVHLHLRDSRYISDSEEFRALALAAGAQIVDDITVTRTGPDAKFFIGSGKVEELRQLVASKEALLVIFDHALSPAQERNLEKVLQCRVLDRTGLILDIFAQRARTYEGKLQVELAQLQHHASRLVRGWTHLERQKGGIGLRGPGETQLEVDRRLLRERIKHIKARLEKVRNQRDQGRRARRKASMLNISLVGYTNAGKSTLFNALTGSEVYVADQLFATLDPTLRILEVPPLGKVILADTVGFIRQLPHDLVEAFRATLEETRDADLLLHVIDSQDEMRASHIEQVERVLQEIDALEVKRIEVYNKIDKLPGVLPHIERDEMGNIQRIYVSAAKDLGLDLVKEAIQAYFSSDLVQGTLYLEASKGRIRALLFELGTVLKETVDESGSSVLNISIPRRIWQKICVENPELEKHWKQTS
jgi:GTP-binding protein HflX